MSNNTAFNDYQREQVEKANKALQIAKAQFNRQENVCVLIPATETAPSYTITCDVTTAQTKYKNYKQFPLNPKKKNVRKISNS